MKKNAAIIGPANLITGFRALGLSIYPTVSEDEALNLIKQLRAEKDPSKNPIAVIFVTEQLVANISAKDWLDITGGDGPAIITIPSLKSNLQLGSKKLDQLTEKAIGTKLHK